MSKFNVYVLAVLVYQFVSTSYGKQNELNFFKDEKNVDYPDGLPSYDSAYKRNSVLHHEPYDSHEDLIERTNTVEGLEGATKKLPAFGKRIYGSHAGPRDRLVSLLRRNNKLTDAAKGFFVKGQRISPIYRRNEIIEGSSYPIKFRKFASMKRPYYYAEPEGSEFLGGPGKRK